MKSVLDELKIINGIVKDSDTTRFIAGTLRGTSSTSLVNLKSVIVPVAGRLTVKHKRKVTSATYNGNTVITINGVSVLDCGNTQVISFTQVVSSGIAVKKGDIIGIQGKVSHASITLEVVDLEICFDYVDSFVEIS